MLCVRSPDSSAQVVPPSVDLNSAASSAPAKTVSGSVSEGSRCQTRGELPGVRRAVVPLVGAGRAVVGEPVPHRPPRLPAVVRALDDLAEPTRRLRCIDAHRVARRADHVVDLPPAEVWAGDLPVRSAAFGGHYERPLLRAYEYPHPGHRALPLSSSYHPDSDVASTRKSSWLTYATPWPLSGEHRPSVGPGRCGRPRQQPWALRRARSATPGVHFQVGVVPQGAHRQQRSALAPLEPVDGPLVPPALPGARDRRMELIGRRSRT